MEDGSAVWCPHGLDDVMTGGIRSKGTDRCIYWLVRVVLYVCEGRIGCVLYPSRPVVKAGLCLGLYLTGNVMHIHSDNFVPVHLAPF